MPIRETKKMMRTAVAIGVAIAFLAVFAMLMLEFPPSWPKRARVGLLPARVGDLHQLLGGDAKIGKDVWLDKFYGLGRQS
jgi:hypothetical protein